MPVHSPIRAIRAMISVNIYVCIYEVYLLRKEGYKVLFRVVSRELYLSIYIYIERERERHTHYLQKISEFSSYKVIIRVTQGYSGLFRVIRVIRVSVPSMLLQV